MINFNAFKRWSLVDFCVNQLGYKINKKSDSARWRCLKTPNGTTILIPSQPNKKGYYIWHALDEGKSGTIVDLLLKIEGMSWRAMFIYSRAL